MFFSFVVIVIGLDFKNEKRNFMMLFVLDGLGGEDKESKKNDVTFVCIFN